LAHDFALSQNRDDDFAAVSLLDVDFDRAVENEINHLAYLFSQHQRRPGGKLFAVIPLAQLRQLLFRHVAKKRELAQYSRGQTIGKHWLHKRSKTICSKLSRSGI